MRLSLRADKSVQKFLKIELKDLRPGTGRSNVIPSVSISIGGRSADCFTGNRVFHSPLKDL